MKSVFKADSIIQRDALISALGSDGIPAQSPPRDLSRKFTDTTVDISYEGYSTFFDGFEILVRDQDTDRAKSLIEKFLRETNVVLAGEAPPPRHLQRFYFCGLFSMLVPVLFHGLAILYLYQGLRAGEKLSFGKTVFAALFYLTGISIVIMTIRAYNGVDL